MLNQIFLEAHSDTKDDNKNSLKNLKLPLESFIAYCIYKYCTPKEVSLTFVNVNTTVSGAVVVHVNDFFDFCDVSKLPWQVASCVYPVILHGDTIVTGLCAVARHICKYRTTPLSLHEYEEGLLGFRKSCLQAPNEVSVWAKFCEVDLPRTVKELLTQTKLLELPRNLIRFENHLDKPVRLHNVYKLARDLKKEQFKLTNNTLINDANVEDKQTNDKERVAKTRKWKSKYKKELEVNHTLGIENLGISHQFAEGPYLTLADLVLLPSYYILKQRIGEAILESLLPLSHKWLKGLLNINELKELVLIFNGIESKPLLIEDLIVPTVENVSLYKCDPKRHNPKKRLFTKEDDIENALFNVKNGMELNVTINNFESEIDWGTIPDGANPKAGHLPDDRMVRKSHQLENLALTVIKIAKEGDVIVDFCSGSGHLGILIAYLLPKCTMILLENKEQSLLRARKRVHDMGLKNVYFFQCNLDFYIGKFDIGIALHACGVASDLVLDKCLKTNAKFVLCPCCYGSLHATDRLVYPRSSKFSNISIDQYLCIGHAADQTHEEHPLTARGARCMVVIDSDRAHLAQELGYKVTLSKLKPLSCTPKNNLLIGVPG